jgi:hypothetical protein
VELRAAVALTQLRRDQGRDGEARELLCRLTVGSPRALTRSISKTQRYCSKNSSKQLNLEPETD